MNNCNIIGKVVKKPELRYTSDNQLAVADLILEFDPPLGNRQEDASKPKIEVVGWGNLATEMADVYKVGDYVIIEGRLEMNTIEKDGYKEKRGRLVANRIHMSSKPVVDTYSPPAQTPPLAQKQTTGKTNQSTYDDEVDQIPF